MPSSATITAFYEFAANTKARASEVNSNFSVFRGHLIPIEPLTIAASNITHDVGSDEHRWRTGYFKYMDFDRNTSTSSFYMHTDPNTTASELLIVRDSATVGRINDQGYINIGGMDASASSVLGGLARTAAGITFDTLSSSLLVEHNIGGSTLTIQTTGRPLAFGLVSGYISVSKETAPAIAPGAGHVQLDLKIGGSQFLSMNVGATHDNTVTAGDAPILIYPSSIFNGVIEYATTGTHTISLSAFIANGVRLTISNAQFYCYEL